MCKMQEIHHEFSIIFVIMNWWFSDLILLLQDAVRWALNINISDWNDKQQKLIYLVVIAMRMSIMLRLDDFKSKQSFMWDYVIKTVGNVMRLLMIIHIKSGITKLRLTTYRFFCSNRFFETSENNSQYWHHQWSNAANSVISLIICPLIKILPWKVTK